MKFFGKVGYATSVERPDQNGVWDDVVVERPYYGDVVHNNRRLSTGAEVSPELTTSNSIEIMADTYAADNIFAMRYVEWAGTRWLVSNVEVRRPRLILQLGGVYNGPTPAPSGTTGGGAG